MISVRFDRSLTLVDVLTRTPRTILRLIKQAPVLGRRWILKNKTKFYHARLRVALIAFPVCQKKHSSLVYVNTEKKVGYTPIEYTECMRSRSASMLRGASACDCTPRTMMKGVGIFFVPYTLNLKGFKMTEFDAITSSSTP